MTTSTLSEKVWPLGIKWLINLYWSTEHSDPAPIGKILKLKMNSQTKTQNQLPSKKPPPPTDISVDCSHSLNKHLIKFLYCCQRCVFNHQIAKNYYCFNLHTLAHDKYLHSAVKQKQTFYWSIFITFILYFPCGACIAHRFPGNNDDSRTLEDFWGLQLHHIMIFRVNPIKWKWTEK